MCGAGNARLDDFPHVGQQRQRRPVLDRQITLCGRVPAQEQSLGRQMHADPPAGAVPELRRQPPDLLLETRGVEAQPETGAGAYQGGLVQSRLIDQFEHGM